MYSVFRTKEHIGLIVKVTAVLRSMVCPLTSGTD